MFLLTGAQINEDRASKAGTEDQKESKKGKIPVIEIFGPTIQGEGGVIGVQTYFARLGGCDYRCSMCDSLHAVLPALVHKNGAWMGQGELADLLIAEMAKTNTKWLTLSGGNPAMHDLTVLVQRLWGAGIQIAVETQGTLWQDWLIDCDYVTVSPKGPGMGETFDPKAFEEHFSRYNYNGVEYSVKFVIMQAADLEFAKDVISKWNLFNFCQVYLSLGNPIPPGKDLEQVTTSQVRETVLNAYAITVDEILQDPFFREARILPQFHVLLWGNKQGV